MAAHLTPTRWSVAVLAITGALALTACGIGSSTDSGIGAGGDGTTVSATTLNDTARNDSTLYTDDPNGSDVFDSTTNTDSPDSTDNAADPADGTLEADLEQELDQILAELEAMAADVDRALNKAAQAEANGG